jgi:hypothetical protein
MALVTVTSPLGKLSLPLPLNQSLGLDESMGRLREKASLSAWQVTPLTTVASTDCHNVWPSRVSPPSHTAPDTSATNITPMSAV